MSEIRTPFEAFRDTDGTPLDGGYVYIGVENQEPITHPANVYWDADLTIAADQPIRTLGGYPVRAGAPSKLYVGGGYSITVKNARGVIVATALSAETLESALADAVWALPSSYVTHAADQAQTYRAFTAAGAAPVFTLTPSPAVTALAEPLGFEVKFAADGTTGSNTLNVSGLGAVALKQYDSTGTLVDGVVKSGQIAKVRYNGTYWVILNPLPATAASGNAGYSDFKASCTGTSAVVTMTAARVTVRNAAGASIELSNVSKTLTMTATGAGGMDAAESLAASTWYYIYFIYNPTTGVSNTLASLSANSPTLPTGYTHYRRMGAFRTDATANKYPLRMKWADDSAEYLPNTTSNLTNWPQIQSGAIGTIGGAPTLSSVAVTGFFPPTASRIRLLHGNVYGEDGNNQIGIESGSNGFYVSYNKGGNRLVEINYVSSIGVAGETGTVVVAVGWSDNGGPIYVEA